MILSTKCSISIIELMTQPHDEQRKNPIGILRFFTSAGTPSKDLLSHFGHVEYDAMIKNFKIFDMAKIAKRYNPANIFSENFKVFDSCLIAGFFQNISIAVKNIRYLRKFLPMAPPICMTASRSSLFSRSSVDILSERADILSLIPAILPSGSLISQFRYSILPSNFRPLWLISFVHSIALSIPSRCFWFSLFIWMRKPLTIKYNGKHIMQIQIICTTVFCSQTKGCATSISYKINTGKPVITGAINKSNIFFMRLYFKLFDATNIDKIFSPAKKFMRVFKLFDSNAGLFKNVNQLYMCNITTAAKNIFFFFQKYLEIGKGCIIFAADFVTKHKSKSEPASGYFYALTAKNIGRSNPCSCCSHVTDAWSQIGSERLFSFNKFLMNK